MTRILAAALLAFSLTASAAFATSIKDLVERDGLFYLKGSEIPFTGEVEGGQIENGRREGLWTLGPTIVIRVGPEAEADREIYRYSSSGWFKDGKRDGPWVARYGSGQLRSKGEYRNGKEHGPWVYFNNLGEKLEERSGTYRYGVLRSPTHHRDRVFFVFGSLWTVLFALMLFQFLYDCRSRELVAVRDYIRFLSEWFRPNNPTHPPWGHILLMHAVVAYLYFLYFLGSDQPFGLHDYLTDDGSSYFIVFVVGLVPVAIIARIVEWWEFGVLGIYIQIAAGAVGSFLTSWWLGGFIPDFLGLEPLFVNILFFYGIYAVIFVALMLKALARGEDRPLQNGLSDRRYMTIAHGVFLSVILGSLLMLWQMWTDTPWQGNFFP